MNKTLIAATAAAALALPAVPALAIVTAPGASEAPGWSATNAFRQRTYVTDNGVRYWRGSNGRTYCRKPNGTVGLLVGGAAGALIGRAVDGGRDRTVGTIVGAAGGALLGREVARSRARCR